MPPSPAEPSREFLRFPSRTLGQGLKGRARAAGGGARAGGGGGAEPPRPPTAPPEGGGHPRRPGPSPTSRRGEQGDREGCGVGAAFPELGGELRSRGVATRGSKEAAPTVLREGAGRYRWAGPSLEGGEGPERRGAGPAPARELEPRGPAEAVLAGGEWDRNLGEAHVS